MATAPAQQQVTTPVLLLLPSVAIMDALPILAMVCSVVSVLLIACLLKDCDQDK